MGKFYDVENEAGPLKTIKLYKTRVPIELRRHPGFNDAKIKVDGDQVCFYLNDKNGIPEIWAYNTLKDGWANVQFIMDSANPQT